MDEEKRLIGKNLWNAINPVSNEIHNADAKPLLGANLWKRLFGPTLNPAAPNFVPAQSTLNPAAPNFVPQQQGGSTTLNLRSYGLDITLTPQFNFNTINQKTVIQSHAQREHTVLKTVGIAMGDVYYKVIDLMGSGSYGTTFKVERGSDKALFAIKYIHRAPASKQAFLQIIKECIIQILLANESKTQPDGPFVPALYEIGYDSRKSEVFIRSELMRNNFKNVIDSFTPEENDVIVPAAIQSIASILDFFYTRLKFNHGDLKSDNIMYVRSAEGARRVFKLIDFGFSCLTWHGLEIKASSDSILKTCYKPDRDLPQLLYEIYTYYKTHISDELRAHIRDILVIRKNGKECTMVKDCHIASWASTYALLNRKTTTAPRGGPSNVRNAMNRFTRRKAKPSPAAPPADDDGCGPGKIRNPKTRRCVKKDGALGKALAAAVPAARKSLKPRKAAPNLARPLIVAAPPPAIAKECPDGKIMNPKTRRCVKKDGKIGAKL